MKKEWLKQRLIAVTKQYDNKAFYKTDFKNNSYWLILDGESLSIEYGRPTNTDHPENTTRWTKRFPEDEERIQEIYDDFKETLIDLEDDDGLDTLMKLELDQVKLIKTQVKEQVKEVTIFDLMPVARKVVKRLEEEVDWTDELDKDEVIFLNRKFAAFEEHDVNGNTARAIETYEDIINDIAKAPKLYKMIEPLIKDI